MSLQNNADIFWKCGNGTLDAVVRRNLEDHLDWNESKGDRNLDVCLDDDEVIAIHSAMFEITYLKAPEIEHYCLKGWDNIRSELSSSFPMLCRIHDMYADALFYKQDVEKLLSECKAIHSLVSNISLDLALQKITYCCNEALKDRLNLAFYCD